MTVDDARTAPERVVIAWAPTDRGDGSGLFNDARVWAGGQVKGWAPKGSPTSGRDSAPTEYSLVSELLAPPRTSGCVHLCEVRVPDVPAFREVHERNTHELASWSDLEGSQIYGSNDEDDVLLIVEQWRSWADRSAYLCSGRAEAARQRLSAVATIQHGMQVSGADFDDNLEVWERISADYQRRHAADMAPGGLWDWDGQAKYYTGLDVIGPVAGLDVVELGCGGGQFGSRLASLGARCLGLDWSHQQLTVAVDRLPVARCRASSLPVASGRVDLVVSAFGAIGGEGPLHAVLAEVARILRPGGRAVWSWVSPLHDLVEVGSSGLTLVRGYFDRRVRDERVVEQHRTYGDWIEAITGAGLQVVSLIEPEPDESQWHGTTRSWWDPQQMRAVPSTLIWDVRKSDGSSRPF